MAGTLTPPRTEASREATPWSVGPAEPQRTNGAPLAALLSAGIGSAVLGVFTTLAQVHSGFKAIVDVDKNLGINAGVGPLSGKTIYAVVAWLVAWGVTAYAMHRKDYDARPFLTATFVLIAVGLLGTFPLFFENFPVLQK